MPLHPDPFNGLGGRYDSNYRLKELDKNNKAWIAVNSKSPQLNQYVWVSLSGCVLLKQYIRVNGAHYWYMDGVKIKVKKSKIKYWQPLTQPAPYIAVG